MKRWEAWWVGDPAMLARAYQQAVDTHPNTENTPPLRRGLKNWMTRMFWTRTKTPKANLAERTDLHVPIATDLCATSADILYSQTPTIRIDAQTAQNQIERYTDDGLYQVLIQGAETGAALGGRYHRVTWDPQIMPRPFLTTIDADGAIPEFTWGKLTGVLFWTVIAEDAATVWRHVETHTLDTNGCDTTTHALYEGTGDNIGNRIPLDARPETAPLTTSTNTEGILNQPPTPGLNVAYIPNQIPQRRWRHHQQAQHYGRSDLDGLEQLMDALDETYSSWMRDIRLGKARVFVDRSMLEVQAAPGVTIPAFDLDQEIFTPLTDMAGSLQDQLPIQPQQFAIRVAEHQATCQELTKKIIRAARYSPSTFGDETQDAQVTATEIRARQAATETTRDRKIRNEKPALQALIVKMLRIDEAVFHTPGLDPENISVQFPPLVQETTDMHAQTAATLRGAELLSREVGVQMVHPDWDQSMVDAEVRRLNSEGPLSSPDQWDEGTPYEQQH